MKHDSLTLVEQKRFGMKQNFGEKQYMKSKKTLWTKDFSCITRPTRTFRYRGEAYGPASACFVFDETQSLFLSYCS